MAKQFKQEHEQKKKYNEKVVLTKFAYFQL